MSASEVLSSLVNSPTLREWFDRFAVPIDDPGSRLFHLNIVAALILVGIYAIVERRGLATYLRRAIFRRRYWWNRSTKIDYQIYALNSVLKVLLFIPFLDLSFFFSRWTVKTLLAIHGDFAGLPAGTAWLAAFTVIAFLWDDFLRFAHHLLMHKVPWLWELHKVHHSARVLTPVTLYRTHPLESAMATLRNSLSLGVAAGFFIFFFEAEMSLVTLFGVNLFGFVFNFLGANLRHSHVPLAFGPLEYLFISPKMHQVHHSRRSEHWDRNYGVSLSIWDSMVGARVLSREAGHVRGVGLDEIHHRALWRHLAAPFLKTFSSSKHSQLAPPAELILPLNLDAVNSKLPPLPENRKEA